MANATMTLRALNRATLARQMLLAREKVPVVRAVERLVGLQAQWPKPPFFGLWSRVEGFQPEVLTRALLARKVVRATMMRGTLHLVSARDYLQLRTTFDPMLSRAMTAVLKDRAKGLDIPRLVAAARAFFDEEPRTFTELRAALMGLYPDGDERAMGFAVRTHLPLVQVPTDATWGFPADSDFAVAETWLGKPLAPADPSHERLVVRYLEAFGPATMADVQAWSGLLGLKETLEALRPKLLVVRDERRRELFDLPDAPRPSEDTDAPVRLLPEFDNLVVSRADARFVPTEHRKKVFLSALRVRATFTVDGFVAGVWKLARAKKAATLVLEPFGALPRAARAELADEASRLVRFAEPDAATFDVRFEKAP